jgi:hypothetical protein
LLTKPENLPRTTASSVKSNKPPEAKLDTATDSDTEVLTRKLTEKRFFYLRMESLRMQKRLLPERKSVSDTGCAR